MFGADGWRRWNWPRAAAVAAVLAAAVQAHAEGSSLVLELFTSQGCGSCPPADALLSDLARRPEVFALSLPVDYWDYMGWKDTLARPEFSVLQKRYAAARGDNHVYTPQAVVDGVEHVVGSDGAEIMAADRRARAQSDVLNVSVQIRRSDAGASIVRVGGGGAASAMLWLMRVAPRETVVVRQGENKGRVLTYTNVVRSIRTIGAWSGQPEDYALPPADIDGETGAFMVLLQAGNQMKPGAVLGAAKSPGL